MILILDGLNGTGKTTIAKRLAERYTYPIYRVFRRPDTPGGDVHWSSGSDTSETSFLKSVGVPYNTFVDDLYTADFLAKVRPRGVILDRSLPSAFAYGRLNGERVWKDLALAKSIWHRWMSMLREYPGSVYYFHFNVSDYELGRSRCAGRWYPDLESWERLKAWFNLTRGSFDAGEAWTIDSGTMTLDAMFDQIVSWIG